MDNDLLAAAEVAVASYRGEVMLNRTAASTLERDECVRAIRQPTRGNYAMDRLFGAAPARGLCLTKLPPSCITCCSTPRFRDIQFRNPDWISLRIFSCRCRKAVAGTVPQARSQPVMTEDLCEYR